MDINIIGIIKSPPDCVIILYYIIYMKSWYNICTLLACSNINNCSTILENNVHCDLPTFTPTPLPTPVPSSEPTTLPTIPPSVHPTYEPSFYPTWTPTMNPTLSPSLPPSERNRPARKNTEQIIIISSVSLFGLIALCVGGKFISKKYYKSNCCNTKC
jgi:hypothetical protein